MKTITKYTLTAAFITTSIILAAFHSPRFFTKDDNPIKAQVQLTEVFPNIQFERPVDFQQPNGETQNVFVVEQRGVISIIKHTPDTKEKTTFLDIEKAVDDASNEEGLLGLAFHPQFQENGYFYVNYTVNKPARTRISRFSVSEKNPSKADPTSELVLLEYDQPYGNHNGGQVSFGPDGFLYVAVGDGGSGGDPKENGQNQATLLGSILRIDVDHPQDGKNYGIPDDNPFAGNDKGYREEIYAYGLRNPWRFSWDAENGQMWAGDVGQNKFEEIDIIENGGNYGWNTVEGLHCFDPSQNCDQSATILPVYEYDHSKGDVSVTGGFVYRGSDLSSLVGKYIFADYVSGRIWSLTRSENGKAQVQELMDADFPISSFGVDQNQELYLCGFDGKIYQLKE